jgi:starch-binding outer membrane protein, SusD/RagB family
LHTWTNETEAIVGMWERYYRGIFECNKTIADQDTASATLIIKKSIAKFIAIRAFYYWLLIDNYGDVPYETSFANANPAPSKTTRSVVFDNLTRELNWAIPYLSNGTIHYSVSKAMAQMTLARLYLNAEVYKGTKMYDKCIPVLEDLVTNSNYTLAAGVKDPFITNNDNCTENIFTIYYDGTESTNGKPEFNLHMRTLGYQSDKTFDMTVGPWNGFATLQNHYNLYTDADLRKSAYFLYGAQKTSSGGPLMDLETATQWEFTPEIPALIISEAGGYTKAQVRHSGVRVQKYEIAKGAGQSLANDFVMFRLTDAYLMLAECYAIIGNAAKVKEYIDPIRTRAGLGAPDTYDLSAVQLERRREMFYEGTRRQDMIRWGTFNTNWWNATSAQFNTQNSNLFPIPKKQTDANPNLLK